MDYSPLRDEAGNRRFGCKFLGNDALLGHATYALRFQDDGSTAWLNVGTGAGTGSSPHTTTYLVGDERFSPIATWLVEHLPRDRVVIHVKQPVDPWTTQASWVASVSAKEQQPGTVQKYAEPPLDGRPAYWDLGLTKSPWDDFDHLFTSQMMSDLGSTGMLTTTFVIAAVKLIQKRGPNPWPISYLEWRLFVDLVDPHPPSSRNSVIIDSQIYMASTEARKQVIESLRGGMMVLPWIEEEHFTLVVGYATTEDHMDCFHIDSLATPRSATPRASILERFIEATRKDLPTISITPVAINTGLQAGGLDCALWVLAAAEFAMQWQPVRDDIQTFESGLMKWLRATPPTRTRRHWRDLILSSVPSCPQTYEMIAAQTPSLKRRQDESLPATDVAKKRREVTPQLSCDGPSPGPPESEEAQTEERPQKRRKARPQLSCDECRRLKLKCDLRSQQPCSSCIHRECEEICRISTKDRISTDTNKSTITNMRTTKGPGNEMESELAQLKHRLASLEGLIRGHAGSARETTTTDTGAISLSGPAPASSSSSANRNLPTITPEDPARTYGPAAFAPTPDYSDTQDSFSYPFERVTPWSSGSFSAQPRQPHPQPHSQHPHRPQHQQQTFKGIIAEMPHSGHRQPLTQPQPHAFPRLPYMSGLQAHQGPGSFPYDPAPRPSGSGNGRNGGGNAIEVTIDPAEEEIWYSALSSAICTPSTLIDNIINGYQAVVSSRHSPRMVHNLHWLRRLRERLDVRMAHTPGEQNGNTGDSTGRGLAEGNVWDSEFNQFWESMIDSGGAHGMSADPGLFNLSGLDALAGTAAGMARQQ